jgi:hypothetical protein
MSSDVLEISYTGDILSHRRCPRAWSYEKLAGFHPYEQIQAMEGRLIHHAMEWLYSQRRDVGAMPSRDALKEKLEQYYRVLYSRGIRTKFASRETTINRILDNLYRGGAPHPIVAVAIEGAQHSEYEMRTVRKLIEGDFAGKRRLMLTGVLDLVVQLEQPITYQRSWIWTDEARLEGRPVDVAIPAAQGDWEIWDYKGVRSDNSNLEDYARQLVTYAALFEERTGRLPARCVLFFVNEGNDDRQLLAIPITRELAKHGIDWTIEQARLLRQSELRFQADPLQAAGGDVETGEIDGELRAQCTTCGQRFDCNAYVGHLGGSDHNDVRLGNVMKN